MGVSSLDAFHFLHPAWLLALPALLLFTVVLARRGQRNPTWSKLVDSDLQPLVRLSAAGRERSPVLWLSVAWTLAVVALAGPAWRRRQSPAFRLPAAWVIVLDLSPSMSAKDVAPDRVTRARYAIEDILSGARDARVGLVVFAGEPHTVAPLTTDVATVRELMRPLDPSLMPESGHLLAPALDEAGRLLRASQGVRGQVIVLTDGSLDPAEAMLAAERLRRQGATVDVVGIGTPQGAPEPDGSGGFVKDASGRTVLTRLATDELRRIAAAGGGRLVSLAGLPKLIAELQAEHSRALSARATAVARVRVAHFSNEGVWLLPPLILLGALLARRGWL